MFCFYIIFKNNNFQERVLMKKFLVSVMVIPAIFIFSLSSNICFAYLCKDVNLFPPIKIQIELGPHQIIPPGAFVNYTVNVKCLLI